MYRIELDPRERIPSSRKGFVDEVRTFREHSANIAGSLVLPFLSDFDPIGVDIRFNDDEIPDAFHPAESYQGAMRIISDDEIAIAAITSVLDRHFSKSHHVLQTELES